MTRKSFTFILSGVLLGAGVAAGSAFIFSIFGYWVALGAGILGGYAGHRVLQEESKKTEILWHTEAPVNKTKH